MKKTVEIVFDSYTKEEVDGKYDNIYLALDDRGWQLHLTEESLAQLLEAIEPFIVDEDDSVSPSTHYRSQREAPAKRTKPESGHGDRADIAAFVEKEGLGQVAARGRIKSEYVEAWEAAGRPRA